MDSIKKAGYNPPSTWTTDNEGWRTTLSKERFVNGNLGNVAIKVLDSNDELGWNFSEYYSKSIISEALEGTPDLENFTLIGENTSMEWHNKEMTLNEFGEVTNFKDEQGKNLNLEEIIETDFLYEYQNICKNGIWRKCQKEI